MNIWQAIRDEWKSSIIPIVSKIKDPMIGQSITKFTTKGCQAQIVEFAWSGIIVEPYYQTTSPNFLFYKVKICSFPSGKTEYKTIPASYIRKTENGEYEIYD